MSGKRAILFFSINCQMCKEVLMALRKNQDLDNSIIKAQAGKVRFPPYIRVVPTVQFDAKGNEIEILTGENVLNWINSLVEKKNEIQPIMDFDPAAMGSGWGGNFVEAGNHLKGVVDGGGMAGLTDGYSIGVEIYQEDQFEDRKRGEENADDARAKMLNQQRMDDLKNIHVTNDRSRAVRPTTETVQRQVGGNYADMDARRRNDKDILIQGGGQGIQSIETRGVSEQTRSIDDIRADRNSIFEGMNPQSPGQLPPIPKRRQLRKL